MGNDMERLIKNVNSDDEIRNICQKNADLKNSLQESRKMPIDILRDVFRDLYMKDTTFSIYELATGKYE